MWTIELPTEVDADHITVEYQNGLRVMTLPKVLEVRPKQIISKSELPFHPLTHRSRSSMMVESTVAVPNPQSVVSSTERTRTQEHYITPPIDIYAMPDSLAVVAEIPGGTQNHLDIRVNNHILTFQGQAQYAVVADIAQRIHALGNVFRQFELSNRVDESHITADAKHGVLTLTLPNAEEARVRQLPVQIS